MTTTLLFLFLSHKGNAQNISEPKKIDSILYLNVRGLLPLFLSPIYDLRETCFCPFGFVELENSKLFYVCEGEFEIISCVRIPGRVIDNEAFGFLVPSSQPEPILGCIYDTSTFRQVTLPSGCWYSGKNLTATTFFFFLDNFN